MGFVRESYSAGPPAMSAWNDSEIDDGLCQYGRHLCARRRSFQGRTRKSGAAAMGSSYPVEKPTPQKSRRAGERHHPDDDELHGLVLRRDFRDAPVGLLNSDVEQWIRRV